MVFLVGMVGSVLAADYQQFKDEGEALNEDLPFSVSEDGVSVDNMEGSLESDSFEDAGGENDQEAKEQFEEAHSAFGDDDALLNYGDNQAQMMLEAEEGESAQSDAFKTIYNTTAKPGGQMEVETLGCEVERKPEDLELETYCFTNDTIGHVRWINSHWWFYCTGGADGTEVRIEGGDANGPGTGPNATGRKDYPQALNRDRTFHYSEGMKQADNPIFEQDCNGDKCTVTWTNPPSSAKKTSFSYSPRYRIDPDSDVIYRDEECEDGFEGPLGSTCEVDDSTWECVDAGAKEISSAGVSGTINADPSIVQRDLDPLYPGDPQNPVCWKANAVAVCQLDVNNCVEVEQSAEMTYQCPDGMEADPATESCREPANADRSCRMGYELHQGSCRKQAYYKPQCPETAGYSEDLGNAAFVAERDGYCLADTEQWPDHDALCPAGGTYQGEYDGAGQCHIEPDWPSACPDGTSENGAGECTGGLLEGQGDVNGFEAHCPVGEYDGNGTCRTTPGASARLTPEDGLVHLASRTIPAAGIQLAQANVDYECPEGTLEGDQCVQPAGSSTEQEEMQGGVPSRVDFCGHDPDGACEGAGYDKSIACDDWYNPYTGITQIELTCEKTTYSCPSGWSLSGTQCVTDAEEVQLCPDGTSPDGDGGCVTDVDGYSPLCPDGTEYEGGGDPYAADPGHCVATLDTSKLCEAPAAWDAEQRACVYDADEEALCPDQTSYDPERDECTAEADFEPQCPEDASFLNGHCHIDPAVEYSCDQGSLEGEDCTVPAEEDASCPAGMTYDGQGGCGYPTGDCSPSVDTSMTEEELQEQFGNCSTVQKEEEIRQEEVEPSTQACIKDQHPTWPGCSMQRNVEIVSAVEDGKILDVSPHDNHGTIIGDVRIDQESGVNFGGPESFVEAPANPGGVEDFSETGITVSTWVKWGGLSGNVSGIWGGTGPNSANNHFEFNRLQPGDLRVRFNKFGGKSSDNYFLEPGIMEEGEWVHVAATYDPETCTGTLYKNGKEVKSRQECSGPIETSSWHRIGNSSGSVSADRGWDGHLHDFTLWKDDLSESEIQDVMDGDIDNSDDRLVGFWLFNDKKVIEDSWDNPECMRYFEELEAYPQGCNMDYETDYSGSGCAVIDGTEVCPGDGLYYQLQPLPGVGQRLATSASFDEMVCDYQGECSTVEGEAVCMGGTNNDCEKFEEDPSCEIVKEQCNSEESHDRLPSWCSSKEVEYACDSNEDSEPETRTTEVLECEGQEYQCADGTCFSHDEEKNEGFGEWVAHSSAMKAMEGDMQCEDENDPSSCTVFEGEERTCRRAAGEASSLWDCCETPKKDKIDADSFYEGLVQGTKETVRSIMEQGILGYISSIENIIKLVARCNEDENMLAIERPMDQTHKIGRECGKRISVVFGKMCVRRDHTYCSFNSPVSRIMQEEARKQLGIGWGSTSNPNCRGLTMEEIQEVDWSEIDTSEWEKLIKENNAMPTADSVDVPSEESLNPSAPSRTENRE